MSRLSRSTLILAGILSVLFLVLLSLFWEFVLDDSYITYRYARNLAEHGAILWNPGSDPVEGYTSFLWVILNALGIWISADPVLSSKILGSLCGLAVIWILALEVRDLHWSLAFPFLTAVALSPFFALLAMQGMETALATLLLVVAARLSLAAQDRPSTRVLLALPGVAFLGFLARPDTAVFNICLLAGVALPVIKERQPGAVKAYAAGVGLFAALFALYMGWRIGYFGHLFPNTYYIKAGVQGGLPAAEGMRYAAGFLTSVALPYLLLAGVLISVKRSRGAMVRIAPILAGTILFAYYITTIIPKQGMAFRFIFPIFPALLLAALHCLSSPAPSPRAGPARPRVIVAVLLVAVFALWPMKGFGRTWRLRQMRTQFDRVAVGKRLADLEGTLVTSESGALPYYSGWKAVDLLGLNSEEIAHEGISEQLLVDLNPDLVMTLCRSPSQICGPPATHPIVRKYLAGHGFVAVAATAKNERRHHLYFVRRSSPLFEEIVERLLKIDGVEYRDPGALLKDTRIPVHGSG